MRHTQLTLSGRNLGGVGSGLMLVSQLRQAASLSEDGFPPELSAIAVHALRLE
jgi:hypothetical protein